MVSSNQVKTSSVGVTATSPQHLGDALVTVNVVGDGEAPLGGGRLGKGMGTVCEVLHGPQPSAVADRHPCVPSVRST